MTEEDKKASPEQVNLRVRNQNGEEIYFKIKKTTMLRKLMDSYCERNSISRSSIRFLYNGTRIQDNQTPKELEMEHDDCIDAVLEQIGGRILNKFL